MLFQTAVVVALGVFLVWCARCDNPTPHTQAKAIAVALIFPNKLWATHIPYLREGQSPLHISDLHLLNVCAILLLVQITKQLSLESHGSRTFVAFGADLPSS